MSSQPVAAIPRSVWSARVASTIRRRVSSTAAARFPMSYFRGDILLTNILRQCIVGLVPPPPHPQANPPPSPPPPRTTPSPLPLPPPSPASPTARGELRWFFGGLLSIKASAADTNGEYTLLEITYPPGVAAPLHVHYHEDEGFYVLEGSATIYVGDEVVELGPGQHAFGPRDVPHRFVIGPEGARMLWVLTPGGFEAFVE